MSGRLSCPSCGRDWNSEEMRTGVCSARDDCPSHWEEKGREHPDHPQPSNGSARQIVYTDGLAAAWMAREHRVRFEQLFYDALGQEIWKTTDCAFLAETFRRFAQGTARWYGCRVHVDSLALYEPRVGDVMRRPKDHAVFIIADDWEIEWSAERSYTCIIQRDGKAWIGGEVRL